MKRLFLSAILITCCVWAVQAQTDVKAKAILDAVSKKYAAYNVIKTEFTYTVENPQAKMKHSESGTLYSRARANKYKIITPSQELISDGKSQWTYLKEDKEVQLSEVDRSNNALNPARLFTLHEKGFKSAYAGDITQKSKVYHVIDLTPIDNKQNFFKIRLNIDKISKHISKAVIFDKSGARYTYVIRTFSPNVKVPESTFAFDAARNPGVEVVDLR